ncbi:MAG: helix-turn-helix transcriptional regulator, partial [Thermoanaerobaculia bacterium]|nr:helix-turn-helix transcriptional regulator [Thermoanaerobaculia bacterium]
GAKRVVGRKNDLASRLHRIALELHSIGVTADFESHAPLPLDHPARGELTERQLEILEQLVSGRRIPAIAGELFLSPHTVRNHLKSIYAKVGVSGQSELIEWARSL